MSEINRNYLSKSFSTAGGQGKEELEEAVSKFLMANGHSMRPKLKWVDFMHLAVYPSCANNDYTRGLVMLQSLFMGTTFGYIAYNQDESYAFKIAFNKHKRSIPEMIEFLERATINITVQYKGQLI